MPPYSFELTLQKPGGWSLFTPFEVYENGILWTTLHIDRLLTGVRLSSSGTVDRPSFKADVFLDASPSESQVDMIRDTLADKLAVNEDLRGFYRMAEADAILKHTVPDLYGMHSTKSGHLFAQATLAILLQMAPWQRSEYMMDCVIKTYGEFAEFDGKAVQVWPLPERIAAVPPEKLQSECKLGYRAKRLSKLAQRLAEGDFPTIERLSAMPEGEARRRLLELPGIGDYSADILNPHGGFPIDVWSAAIFGKLFFGRETVGRDDIEKIKAEGVRRWGRWSWLAFMYIVHDLPKLSDKLGATLRLH